VDGTDNFASIFVSGYESADGSTFSFFAGSQFFGLFGPASSTETVRGGATFLPYFVTLDSEGKPDTSGLLTQSGSAGFSLTDNCGIQHVQVFSDSLTCDSITFSSDLRTRRDSSSPNPYRYQNPVNLQILAVDFSGVPAAFTIQVIPVDLSPPVVPMLADEARPVFAGEQALDEKICLSHFVDVKSSLFYDNCGMSEENWKFVFPEEWAGSGLPEGEDGENGGVYGNATEFLMTDSTGCVDLTYPCLNEGEEPYQLGVHWEFTDAGFNKVIKEVAIFVSVPCANSPTANPEKTTGSPPPPPPPRRRDLASADTNDLASADTKLESLTLVHTVTPKEAGLRFGHAFNKAAYLFKVSLDGDAEATATECARLCLNEAACEGVFILEASSKRPATCVGLSDLGDPVRTISASRSYRK
jgi:hypothetical protein